MILYDHDSSENSNSFYEILFRCVTDNIPSNPSEEQAQKNFDAIKTHAECNMKDILAGDDTGPLSFFEFRRISNFS